MIDRGDAQFDRFQILIGHFDVFQRLLHQSRLFDRLAVQPIGEGFARFIGIGQFVFIAKRGTVDQLINVRSVSPFGIGKHPQRGRFHIAAHLLGIGQRMGADEVLRQGFVSHRAFIGRFGQHFGLQGQQVAEDARQGHQHVNPWAVKVSKGYQISPTQAAISVKARLGTHQRQGLGNRPAVRLDIVRPPQHQRDRARQGRVGSQQLVGLRRPIAQSEFGGHPEGVKGVDVAARGQDLGRADQVATRHGFDKAGRHGAQNGWNFAVLLQQVVNLGALRILHRGQQRHIFRPRLIAHHLAHDVQAIGDQGIFRL